MSGTEFSGSSEERVHDADADQENGHFFGRQKPVDTALGGKPAGTVAWRNTQISAAVLATSTIMWLLFQRIVGHYFITFICYSLMLSFSTIFLWSNLSFFLNGSTLKLPEITVPEDLCKNVALSISDKCNKAAVIFREVALGNDLKKFLYTILAFWVVSIVGSWLDFLTLVYIIFVVLLTMPPSSEKHEEKVDTCAPKAKVKLTRQYGLDEKVLIQKLPQVSFIVDDTNHE